MINFDQRIGPDLGTAAPTYPAPGAPDWWRDAKLGFFIHWGLYSLPAWATVHPEGGVPAEDAYAHHQYAEWYGNTVRITGSPTWQRHQRVYGTGTSYEDLADHWNVGRFDADALVARIVDAGARYVIPTTKHHDGFCLWDTATTGFNAVRRGPGRDLIGELHDATRRRDTRFGVYFSGALDWHTSDFGPIESDTDLFRFRRNDVAFARYAAAQVGELVDRFAPDVLWNDIEWPDGGKGAHDFGVAALLRRYLARVPDGVVNDRWGVPFHGFLTREYTRIDDIIAEPWEATRGLGFSFGYNQDESEEESLSGAELIRLLVDVVSKNGNLLINVGPRADGSIPGVQAAAMAHLGAWLRTNGEAIYATRTWDRFGEPSGPPVRYTRRGSTVYLHLLDPTVGEVRVPSELADRPLRWLGAQGHGSTVPDRLRGEPVAVAAIG